MSSKGGLGRGLGAIFEANPGLAPKKDQVVELSLDEIQANRYQPRTDFDETALQELADSMKEYGVLTPILVRKLPAREGEKAYELIAGERRLRAARLAGLERVPCLVRTYNDAETSEIALIENLQREDLNPIEEAEAYQQLLEQFHLTQEELARKVGRSRPHIANFLRLLKLPQQVRASVANGTLSMGQARPLAALEDAALIERAADFIEEHELSARQSEALVKRLQKDPGALEAEAKPRQKEKEQEPFVREAQDHLSELLGTRVRILPGRKTSHIQIDFYGTEDLNRLLDILNQLRSHPGTGGAAVPPAMDKQQKIEALRKLSTTGHFTV